MSIKVVCEKGTELDKTYFVATDEAGGRKVVRASRILSPKLHTLANEDVDDKTPKLEVQPEDFIKRFERMCPDLESFSKLAYSIALNNEGVGVTAAKESDSPTWSLEDPDKIKVDKEPTVAAEETMVADSVKSESAPETRKFFNRLPGKAVGAPEQALDLQSAVTRLKAAEEELKKVTDEKDGLKKENEGMKKAGVADKVLKLLAELGVAEDAKDKEAYTKKLSGLQEQAMGVLESILKDVLNAENGEEKAEMGGAPKAAPKPFGGPKPPIGGGGMPKKPEGMEAPLDSRANVVHASYEDYGIGSNATDISGLWLKADRAKELSTK